VPLEQNLIYRAAMLLKAKASHPVGARIQLDKQLPMGGGLGGGLPMRPPPWSPSISYGR